MKPLPFAILVPLLIVGCGGSGTAEPMRQFDFTVDSNSFNGNATPITVIGQGTTNPQGAIATFTQGNRILEIVLPSAAPGTYPFGEAANKAQATYGESGVVGTNGWATTTDGTVTVSGSGLDTRLTLKGVRFLPSSGTPARGPFLLSGPGSARLVPDPGGLPL